jgi:hypothetical protein
MPDFFTVGKKPIYIGATPDLVRKVIKAGGSPVFHSNSEEASKNDEELKLNTPLVVDRGTWIVSPVDSPHIMVDDADPADLPKPKAPAKGGASRKKS